VPEARPVRPRHVRGARRRPRARCRLLARRRPAAARRVGRGAVCRGTRMKERTGPRPRPLPEGFAAYIWASTAEEVAERRGLDPAQVIRFDANVPPLPGVPQIPLGAALARLNEYPEGSFRELREAAAAYAGVEPEQIAIDAGADGIIMLVARTFLAPGRRAAVAGPTYPLYRIATGIEGAEAYEAPLASLDAETLRGADVVWVCNPNNPNGAILPAAELAALARELPETV